MRAHPETQPLERCEPKMAKKNFEESEKSLTVKENAALANAVKAMTSAEFDSLTEGGQEIDLPQAHRLDVGQGVIGIYRESLAVDFIDSDTGEEKSFNIYRLDIGADDDLWVSGGIGLEKRMKHVRLNATVAIRRGDNVPAKKKGHTMGVYQVAVLP